MIPRGRAPIDPKRMRVALIAGGVLVAVAIAIFLARPHENRFEREARRITEAIRANDLTPVAADFTRNTRAAFTRASVGQASDRFNTLGALQRVRETTPQDAPPGAHDFLAVFDRADVPEHLRYEIGGEIVTFHYDAPVPH